MTSVLTVSGSPGARSRSTHVVAHAGAVLAREGFAVDALALRELPAEALLAARVDDPAVRDAVARLQRADGVVLATPIYKAAYSGLLKVFLDLLPQFGLAGKTVLPLATGGSLAHVLALDYALRPVLSSMGVRHVTSGFFVAEQQLRALEGGGYEFEGDTQARLDAVIAEFATSLRHAPPR